MNTARVGEYYTDRVGDTSDLVESNQDQLAGGLLLLLFSQRKPSVVVTNFFISDICHTYLKETSW